MFCIEPWGLHMPSWKCMHTKKPADAVHATHPPDERPHALARPNPDDTARWLALADIALRHAPSDEHVAELEALARKEQAAIKKRIRHTVLQVRGQSKSKQ